MLVFTVYSQILNHGNEYFGKLLYIMANRDTIFTMKTEYHRNNIILAKITHFVSPLRKSYTKRFH